ncbi:MAG: hypothetical protein R3E32_24200 [Chitinophagales bacterium]
MKTLLQMTFVFLTFFTSMNSSAQSLVGLWTEPTYQMQLQLNADGTYQLQYAQGNSYGQYALQGNQFWLQDAYGNALAYTTHQLTTTNFQISDANGIVMNFVNQNTATTYQSTPTNSHSTVAAPWEQAKYDQQLAQNGSQVLKEREVRIYAALLEFLIEANLKPYQIAQLQQEAVADFEANPSALLQDAAQVGEAMKTIYALKDVAKIGAARQELFTTLHAFAQQNAASQQSAFFKILYEHLKVLAFDAANKLVLTDKDVAAYIRYVEFTNQLAGTNQVFSAQEKRDFEQQLIGGFPQLSLEQKQVFCSARLLWQLVDANWRQLSAAQQQQVKAQVMANVANPNAAVGNNGSYNEGVKDYSTMSGEEVMADINADLKRWADEKGMTVEEYLEYRQGFNATFQTLQRMSMESHASMMNVINHMGGSDDYWTVRDVDSAGNIIW